MIPSDRDLLRARQWWDHLPDFIKGKYSIWTILAMYGAEVEARGRGVSEKSTRKTTLVLDRKQGAE
jgi:hypothetical protein